MKASLIISIILLLFIGYQCLRPTKENCPYGSELSDTNKSKVEALRLEDKKLISAISYRKGGEHNKIRQIPYLIMQTNEKQEIPEKMFEATNTILESNPEYEYVYFTDQGAREFLQKYFDQRLVDAYDKIIPGAYKADLFRYCFLWIRGGVYIDMGMASLKELDTIIRPDDTFVAPEDNGTNGIYNAFMACTPAHPIIKEAIVLSIQNIENENYTRTPLGITGPVLLGVAFENVTGQKVNPNKEYGDGIRIIKYHKYNRCVSGIIYDDGTTILATRYPSYRLDQMWYNTNPHYSEMWKAGRVFG